MAKIKKCQFSQFIKEILQDRLEVWLFGCGEKGRQFVSKYKTTGILHHIKGFIDNNPKMHGCIITIENVDFPVISLQQFTNQKTEQDVLLITSSYVLDILEQINHIEELNDISCYIDYLLEEIYEPQDFTLVSNRKAVIPQKIHYCWFGRGEIPKEFRYYMESWEQYCPDYEIIQWDETNYDVEKCAYMKEAYAAKKWAFVSDYARLDILKEYGGIYLDTDVALVKSLDTFLPYDFFCGFERNNYIGFGLGYGSIPHHPILENLINTYNKLHFIENGKMNLTPCAVYQLEAMLQYGFVHENKYQVIDQTAVFPSEVFAPENSLQIMTTETEQTYSIHHYSSTWWDRGADIELNKLREKVIQCLKYE